MDDAAHNPATTPAPGSYHWTPRLQREFLEAFATNGSVKISAAKVGMSPSAVYQLKQRPQGAAFKLGCAAALLIARGRLVDELLDRAIWGYEETSTIMREEGRSFVKRQRLDPRLGLAMLARLDKIVETRARAGEEMLAQIITGDWPGFLSLFDTADVLAPEGASAETVSGAGEHAEPRAEGLAAALGLWLAGRDNRANPLASLWKNSAIANEVTQISADSAPRPRAAPTAEDRAADMTVWTDPETGQRRTDFPPPEDFLGIETGKFGDYHYERSMDPEEEAAFRAACEADLAPLRHAGEAAPRLLRPARPRQRSRARERKRAEIGWWLNPPGREAMGRWRRPSTALQALRMNCALGAASTEGRMALPLPRLHHALWARPPMSSGHGGSRRLTIPRSRPHIGGTAARITSRPPRLRDPRDDGALPLTPEEPRP